MPHVGGGGGSGGGGFHSGSSKSSVPRYDKHGNLHSTYYVRPGYYYKGTYVPLNPRKRWVMFLPPCIILFSVILMIALVIIAIQDYSYDSSKLETYALEQYYQVYDEKDNSFEMNILVTLVVYENNSEYDYISIVGDNIDTKVDLQFGNTNTTFGKLVYDNIPSEGYYDNLYHYISKAINEITKTYSNKFYFENTYDSKIINKTNFGEINGKEELENAQRDFYEKTGYNISLVVDDNKDVYKPDIIIVIIVIIFAVILVFLAINLFNKNKKSLKIIKTAEEKGNAKNFFEGEDTYETYFPNEMNSEMEDK